MSTKNNTDSIKNWLKRYADIVNNGDFEKYCSLWTENVIWVPPDAPIVIGKKAIMDFAEPFFTDYDIEYRPTLEEVKLEGDLAYLRFSVVEKYIPKVKDSETIVLHDKDLIILKKEGDGSWVGSYGIWYEDEKSKTKIEEQNKELLRQYYSELDKTNIERLDDFLNKIM